MLMLIYVLSVQPLLSTGAVSPHPSGTVTTPRHPPEATVTLGLTPWTTTLMVRCTPAFPLHHHHHFISPLACPFGSPPPCSVHPVHPTLLPHTGSVFHRQPPRRKAVSRGSISFSASELSLLFGSVLPGCKSHGHLRGLPPPKRPGFQNIARHHMTLRGSRPGSSFDKCADVFTLGLCFALA